MLYRLAESWTNHTTDRAVPRRRRGATGLRVALKVIQPERVGSVDATARFLFEAQIAARFSHPNIVTIYAVGEHQGQPYVAKEYLEGQTLRERIAQERPGAREGLRILRDVAAALAEAHRQGVLHRDLEPENAEPSPRRRLVAAGARGRRRSSPGSARFHQVAAAGVCDFVRRLPARRRTGSEGQCLAGCDKAAGTVSLGRRLQYERQRWFRRGRAWRAGGETRIARLKDPSAKMR